MNNILLCTDGSGYAQVAYNYACWISERTSTDVEAVYVTDIRQFEVPLVADISGSLGVQPYQDIIAQIQAVEDKKSDFIKEYAKKHFDEKGLGERFSFKHKTGLLVEIMEDLEKSADLVVLGKRGENHERASGHLGSNLDRVIRASKKPCLVTNRTYREIKRIAIAYDDSASSRKALEWIAKGELFNGLELHILTVSEDGNEDEASQRLGAAEEVAKTSGCTVSCQMLSGVAEEALEHYVENQAVDLLVMGAYGHSRFRYLFVGSTTTTLLRNCHIPVLCFR